jgi:hypothetical protein
LLARSSSDWKWIFAPAPSGPQLPDPSRPAASFDLSAMERPVSVTITDTEAPRRSRQHSANHKFVQSRPFGRR